MAEERKTITKTSQLENIAKGDVVNVMGIANENQNDEGLVVFADPGKLGVKMVATRVNTHGKVPDHIAIRSYFQTPSGVRQSSSVKYNFGSTLYSVYDKSLSEAGL